MKVLRVLGGWLIISGGVFCCMIAYSQSGGRDGWSSFRPEQMLEREPVFAIGGPIVLLLGVAASNYKSSGLFFLPALLIAIAAAGLGLWLVTSDRIEHSTALLIVVAVLTLAAAITAALGRKRLPAVS